MENRKMKKLFLLFAVSLMLFVSANHTLAADTADIIFVVDESGSMYGEHAWLATMVTQLETGLLNAGVTNNRYGLVGYGGGSIHYTGHKHDVDNTTIGLQDWGTAAGLSAATGGLVLTGGTEDGWEAINFALNNYSFRSDAAVNIVLITDEDRDTWPAPGLTYNDVLTNLNGQNAILNVVVDASMRDGSDNTVLGVSNDQFDDDLNLLGDCYLADGSGGYTYSDGGYYYSGFGTTETDYFNLALDTDGAAWDLNQLRAGGDTALSFTDAFVDIKVKEIRDDDVPEPAFMFLIGSGMIGIAAIRKKIK